MAGENALSPVAAAVYTALNVSAMTNLATGGVWDDVPEGTAFPYVWVRVSERTNDYMGGHAGFEVDVRVHVFSQFRGAAEAQSIISKARQLLRHTLPAVSGFTALLLEHEGTSELADEMIQEKRTKHLIARFRLEVEE